MLKSATEKQRKRVYQFEKLKSSGIPKRNLRNLIRKMKQNIPVKPNCKNILPELNSICCEMIYPELEIFDSVLVLKSIFRDKRRIMLPIKHTKHSKRLEARGSLMTSFLIGEDFVCGRYKIEDKKKKTSGIVVGADQGLKTVLTFSNGDVTSKIDNHNHSLMSITKKLARKRKGSNHSRERKNIEEILLIGR